MPEPKVGNNRGNAGKGRPKGSRNKTTALLKDAIIEAATKALRDGHHGYTPAAGIAELRQAVSADIDKRRGVTVDPGDVMIVPGGKVTMFFAILMFGEAGAEILYPNPGFPIYESAINFTGAKAVPMPLWSRSGATTCTSPTSLRASARAQRPGAWTPSSLVTRILNG